jgi:hypothetical protein
MDNYQIINDILGAVRPLAPLGRVLLTVYALYWFVLGIYRVMYLSGRLLMVPDSENHSVPPSYHAVHKTKIGCVHYSLSGVLRCCTKWSVLQASEQAPRQKLNFLVLAGQDTTGRLICFELWDTTVGWPEKAYYTLFSLTYQISANPNVYRKLKAELVQAIPDSDAPLSSTSLEQPPYLTAVIQENIRLHPGALVRQSRVATEQSMIYVDPKTKKK